MKKKSQNSTKKSLKTCTTKQPVNPKARKLQRTYSQFFALMLTSGVAHSLEESYYDLLEAVEKDVSNDDIRDAAIDVLAQLGGWFKYGRNVRSKREKKRGTNSKKRTRRAG